MSGFLELNDCVLLFFEVILLLMTPCPARSRLDLKGLIKKGILVFLHLFIFPK